MEPTVSKMEALKDTFLILAGLGGLAIGLAANYRLRTVLIWSTAFTVAASFAALHARWHTWFTRRLLIFGCSVTLIACGIWQYHGESQTSESETFTFAERPSLSIEKTKPVRLKAGEKAVVAVTLQNRGTAPARTVRGAGRVEIRTRPPHPQQGPCPPIVLRNLEKVSQLPTVPVAIGSTSNALIESKEVLSESTVQRIMAGEQFMWIYLRMEYGRDGKTTPYYVEYYAYFDSPLGSLVLCPHNNEAN